jgi:hypothetical protein
MRYRLTYDDDDFGVRIERDASDSFEHDAAWLLSQLINSLDSGGNLNAYLLLAKIVADHPNDESDDGSDFGPAWKLMRDGARRYVAESGRAD